MASPINRRIVCPRIRYACDASHALGRFPTQTRCHKASGFLLRHDGIEVLAAASPALNRAGEGSSPSSPTEPQALVSSGQDSAPVMRRRGFESHPVLWLFDNLVIAKRAHDVAAACRLAMADVRVQIPLDALPQDVGKPGNPPAWGAGERRFKSDHPD